MSGESLARRLERAIESSGPISVARYMAEANAHYYGTRDPFGAAGDFTTAPEISQMFGELVGLWLGDLWLRAGKPEGVRYVELGPGRGTLAADALRAMARAGLSPDVEFVEISPVLREVQSQRVPHALWHDDLGSVGDGPLLIVANEFFDALPAHQLIATPGGWRERLVAFENGSFQPIPGPPAAEAAIPPQLRGAPPGTVIETSPASISVIRQIAEHLRQSGGAALIIDYGHTRTSGGETLQAVSSHGFVDPWQESGERDLTVHVDFEALREAARGAEVRVLGPCSQGKWLETMGIKLRAAALAAAAPDKAEEIETARRRLVAPEEMGELFKVMALVAEGWPEPAGFA